MKKISLSVLILISMLEAEDLRTVVKEVLSTNPIVLERLKNYNLTKEDITTAKAGFYPKLDLSIGAGIERTEKRGTSNGGYSDGNFNYSVYQNSLKYTHNIFQGFATTYQVEEQKNRTISAAYSYIENVNATAFEMVNEYLQVMRNKELLNNEDENVKINEEILNKVQKIYESGLTTLSEVNKIESALALAKSNYIVQENTLMDFTYNLHKVLGRYLNYDEMIKPELNVELPATLEDATEFAIQNNPSLLVEKYNIKLAQATYKEKKSPFYPRIDIEVSQSLNKNLSAIEGENNTFRAMATLSYNIFNGFSDSAALQKNLSTIHQEVQIKNKLRREVITGLNLSWVAYEKLTAQLEYLNKYRDFSLKTLTLYSKEYDLGRRSLLDLLSAQNDFIGSKAQIINTEYSRLYAKYRILDAMGILVSTVVEDTDIVYNRVGLLDITPKNDDTLPILYDTDKDLIVDEEDICSNSLQDKIRNLHGCKHIYDDTLRIERYSGFLFKDGRATLSDVGQERLGALIKQVKPYGFNNLKFDLLGNVNDDSMSKENKLKLSQSRAETVKKQLIAAGAIEKNIIIHAKADIAPMYSDETSNGIKLNNRVDIAVRKLIIKNKRK
jgi:adhesin transport system outer membrane protein